MKYLLSIILLVIGIAACKQKEVRTSTSEETLEPLSYTLYSGKSELFVEFKPLVVGQTSRFAAHLTLLGENFLPYTEGSVTVSVIQDGKGLKNSAALPASPGIFRLGLQPVKAGMGMLVFDIQTKNFSDQFVIDSIQVYADVKTALENHETDAGTDISYLKEQAWKVEFANMPVAKEIIYDVVKTTGEILSAPGDEVTIAAKTNGIVKFVGNNNVIGAPVSSGQSVFNVSGGEIAFENVEAAKQNARAELAAAKAEYDRKGELMKDKLITQSEYQQARLRYQQAQISLSNLSRNYSAGGKTLTSPISGFIKSIMVSEGQFVSAGQPLATITKNQRLLLRADVSLKDADRISSIQEANFTIIQNKQSFNTKDLNGRVLATAKSMTGNSPFIPVHFQIDSRPGMLPGSFAEVFLKTTPIADALVIPVSALVEEQGIFYVYVQTGGESFQKRELKLGANDGVRVQVTSGLAAGERVVIKGGYQIKLSQASGALPAHGHEH